MFWIQPNSDDHVEPALTSAQSREAVEEANRQQLLLEMSRGMTLQEMSDCFISWMHNTNDADIDPEALEHFTNIVRKHAWFIERNQI